MQKVLSALIIDDEKWSRENLNHILTTYCPEVNVLKKISKASDAKIFLLTQKVDVIFLDIEMPEMNGFDFLASLDNIDFQVVFVSAYDQYGIQAIKSRAFDYLLKPISIKEIQDCVVRLLEEEYQPKSPEEFQQDLLAVKDILNPKKIMLPDNFGFILVEEHELIRLEADNSYTLLFIAKQKKQLSSKNLKFFESILTGHNFIRVHKSHIINISHIHSFSKLHGPHVVLSDGAEVPISRRKLPEFIERINTYTRISLDL